METAQYIIASAMQLLERNSALPIEIPEAPGYFLASRDDDSIQAFDTMAYMGETYKLGVKK